MTRHPAPGGAEKAVRAELRSLNVSVVTSTRAALAVNLARRVDDPATSTAAAAAAAGRIDVLLDRVRSLRVPGPDVAGDEGGKTIPAVVTAPDAVAKARAAREARRSGGVG